MSRDYVQRLRDEAAEKEPASDTPKTDAYQDSIYEAEIIKHPLREFKAAMGFAGQMEMDLAAARAAIKAGLPYLLGMAETLALDNSPEVIHLHENVAKMKAALK